MNFSNKDGGKIIFELIKTIQDKKDFLSEVDGKIGDGDHGINMNKGFTMTYCKVNGKDYDMTTAFSVLGDTLLEDIGGSWDLCTEHSLMVYQKLLKITT